MNLIFQWIVIGHLGFDLIAFWLLWYTFLMARPTAKDSPDEGLLSNWNVIATRTARIQVGLSWGFFSELDPLAHIFPVIVCKCQHSLHSQIEWRRWLIRLKALCLAFRTRTQTRTQPLVRLRNRGLVDFVDFAAGQRMLWTQKTNGWTESCLLHWLPQNINKHFVYFLNKNDTGRQAETRTHTRSHKLLELKASGRVAVVAEPFLAFLSACCFSACDMQLAGGWCWSWGQKWNRNLCNCSSRIPLFNHWRVCWCPVRP